MATVTEQAQIVLDVLAAGLPEVQHASVTSYMPTIQASALALVSVAQSHSDDAYFYSGGWLHGVHRLRFEFWVKVVQGEEVDYQRIARNIGYEAMKILVAHHGEGYVLANSGNGVAMTSSVEERMVTAGGLPYLVVTLTVPVQQKETV